MLHYETKLLSSIIFIFYRNKYEYSKSKTSHHYGNNFQHSYNSIKPPQPPAWRRCYKLGKRVVLTFWNHKKRKILRKIL